MNEFIEEHEKKLEKGIFDQDFLAYHLTQVSFLQHERLAHLLVMLFVIFSFLLFLVLFLVFGDILLLGVFLLSLVLAVFYIFHYFKLENTVIRWYFIYNDHV